MSNLHNQKTFIIPIATLIIVGLLGYGGYSFYSLNSKFQEAQSSSGLVIEELEERVATLETELAYSKSENEILAEALDREQNKNSIFEERIREIAGTVGIIERWSQTDPELLQKYSKVYFLNEHYTPSGLSEIPSKYLYNTERNMRIHNQVLPYLEDMMKVAESDGMDLKIISAYRSFGEQESIKSQYTVVYGEGANQFSADQGYSEHQLGTAVDFTTPQVGASFSGFENTKEYQWLRENAHWYGFVLSYPEGNAYYVFEPWHWRFVGTSLARHLHREGVYFYDVDQREINQYLVDIFN